MQNQAHHTYIYKVIKRAYALTIKYVNPYVGRVGIGWRASVNSRVGLRGLLYEQAARRRGALLRDQAHPAARGIEVDDLLVV